MTADNEQHQKDQETIWEPRQTSAARSVAQYSRFVSAMKVALPVAAGVLLFLVVVLPLFRDDDARFRIGMNLIKGSSGETLSMTNARYFGNDNKGQPYSVTAAGVRQHAKDDRGVDLVGPKAEIKLTNGSALSAEATSGLYDRDNQKLDLAGQVTVSHNQDNHLYTTSAVVMLKEGTASGRDPVSSDGPYGTMHAAGGFDMSDRGQIIHFHGASTLTLTPHNKANTPAAGQPAAPMPAVGAKP